MFSARWLLLLCIAAPVGAVEPTLDYTVRPQDTLIGLSRTLLVEPKAWIEVARLNHLRDPNRIDPGQVLKLPLRLLHVSSDPARLSAVEGQVNLDGQTVAADHTVQPGQRLVTEASSSAVLKLGDGSVIKLLPQTEVLLDDHRRFVIRAATAQAAEEGVFAGTLRLLRGSLELLASKVLRAKPLEVQTPTAVIGVRGTAYRVHHHAALDAPPTSRSEVLSGQVRADLTEGSTGVDLRAGQGAVVRRGDSMPRVAALPPAPDLSGLPQRFERPVVRFRPPAETLAWRVQVAADAGFERISRDEIVAAGSEVRLSGLADGLWHLRARRLEANGLGGADAATTFELKARPEPPAAMAPVPQARLSVGAVEFRWTDNPDAAQYRIEIARDAGFQQVVHRVDSLAAPLTRLSLPEPGHYHWRLAAVRPDGDRGPWGDANAFELRALPANPTGGMSEDGRSLNLAWSGRAADRQVVELARDAGFTDVVARAELQATQWQLPKPQQPGSYHFRYRAIEPDGYISPWSSTLQLEVPRDWGFLWYLSPFLLAL